MKVDVDEIGGAATNASSDNDTFHYGIGGGYRFNEHWEILLDFSEYTRTMWAHAERRFRLLQSG